jgi:pectate lyase
MKLSAALLLLAAAVASASPTKVLAKRATITDAANIGYAQQNGG